MFFNPSSVLSFVRFCSDSRVQTRKERLPKRRRLRFESLENRELLSATSWNDDAGVEPVEASTATSVYNEAEEAIDNLLVAAGQNPEKLTQKFIFGLSSLPSAKQTIYLDFNGHTCSGNTLWGRSITTSAYSLDSNRSSFSNDELKSIYEIWLRVAEDFAPFNVNVTTSEPSLNDLIKSDEYDERYGVRVCIGGGSWYASYCGGVSYPDTFTADTDTPAYVFATVLETAKNVAESASHEIGHTLGLDHDGAYSREYYYGADGWAPIMGAGYNQALTQWSKGEYSGATNCEDDLAIITSNNGFGYRTDDYGDTIATAKTISVTAGKTCASGIIERNTDVDFFKFKYNGGDLYLQVGGVENITNLDAFVRLYDSSGKLVQTYNPTDSTSALVEMTGRASGYYYLSVAGTGLKLNGKTIYSDYGSLGQYTIVATSEAPDVDLKAPGDLILGEYNASSRKVSLSWTDNSNYETGYRVEYSSDGGSTWTLSEIMSANSTSRVATGVKVNSQYRFRVCALYGSKYSDWAYSEILDTGVAAPSGLTLDAYDAVARTVALSWTDNSSNETGFRVEYSIDGGYSWNLSETTSANSTSRVATGLKTDSQYKFRVCAVYGSKYSDWTYSETLDASVNAPSGLTIEDYDATSRTATLKWRDNSANETGFRVEFSSDGGSTWNLAEIMAADSTSRVATNLKANLKYQFRVCALFGKKYSDWTYSEILDSGVVAPGNLTLGDYDSTNRTVLLSWTDNSSAETGFRVECSSDGGSTWNLAEIMVADSTSRLATCLRANSLYQFRVCALYGKNLSDWAYSEILDTSANAPSDLKLGEYDATNRRVSLSWIDNSSNETGFRVEFSSDGGRTWALSEIMAADSTSRVATGVKTNSQYQFRVCALFGKTASDWIYSEILNTSVKPNAPSALTLGEYNPNDRSVSASWKDNSDNETGFRFEFSLDGGTSWDLSEIMSANSTSRVATSLRANAQYRFRVCALRGNERSDWTYSETLDTSVSPLAAPGALTLGAYDASTRRVALSWTDNSNNETGFRVEYSTDGGTTWRLSETMDANSTSRVATGVQANLLYQFRVCAVRGTSCSDWAYSKILNTVVPAKASVPASLFDELEDWLDFE